MSRLLTNLIDEPETNSRLTKSLSRQLSSVIDPVVQNAGYYEERLANYLDTQAWLRFRFGTSKDLITAFKMLSTGAIKYGPNIAVTYYHLTRVCIGKIENLWQATSAANRKLKAIPTKTAIEITNLLRLSFLYWRQAAKLNHSGSLHIRLSRVHARLIAYRREWELLYRVNTGITDSE